MFSNEYENRLSLLCLLNYMYIKVTNKIENILNIFLFKIRNKPITNHGEYIRFAPTLIHIFNHNYISTYLFFTKYLKKYG